MAQQQKEVKQKEVKFVLYAPEQHFSKQESSHVQQEQQHATVTESTLAHVGMWNQEVMKQMELNRRREMQTGDPWEGLLPLKPVEISEDELERFCKK